MTSHTSERVEFPSNGDTVGGYLARPEQGDAPGVIMIQEWWGLESGLMEMADRLAHEGFVVLCPDLYRGELAEHTEMDRAAELMNELPPDRAARDMSGAVDYLAAHPNVTGERLGAMGFCMGGLLSFYLAANRPDRIAAVVPFYGFPLGDDEPDYSAITAPIQGHMAEIDDVFTTDKAKALEARLREMGKDVSFTVYAGTGHAFMAPHNALGTQDMAAYEEAWPRAVGFLHEHLD